MNHLTMNSNYALITGASSGIGLELAKIFARHHYNLVLIARSYSVMNHLSKELLKLYPIDIRIFPIDLSEPGSPQKIFDYTQNESLKISVLVNNAGFGWNESFISSSWSIHLNLIQVNLVALCELTHLFLPMMNQRKEGKILNVASTAAFQPGPYLATYYASKAFVLNFSEALYEELLDHGITVTALCPGPTQSEFQKNARMDKAFLFKFFPVPSAEEVALFGYKELMKGKAIAIHGWLNKIMTLLVRITPRLVVRKIIMQIQKPSLKN